MRISDWSSDVCSSDLPPDALGQPVAPADGSIRLSHFAALGVADRRQSGSGRSCGGRRNKRSAWRNVGLAVPAHHRAAVWTEADVARLDADRQGPSVGIRRIAKAGDERPHRYTAGRAHSACDDGNNSTAGETLGNVGDGYG